VLIDEIYVSEFTNDPKGSHERLSEAVELALTEANGLVKIESPDGSKRTLSAKFICPVDGSSFPEVEPRLFSFNSPYGACSECNGLGAIGIFQSDECTACKGARLRPEALRVYLGGDGKKSLGTNIVGLYKFYRSGSSRIRNKFKTIKKTRRNSLAGAS